MRSMAHHEKKRQERLFVEELAGGQVAYKVEKAVTIQTPRDDFVMPAEKKDDALHHIVNHAHQRRPDKKW